MAMGHFATLRFVCTINHKSLNYKNDGNQSKVFEASYNNSYTSSRAESLRLSEAQASVNSSEILSLLWLLVISLA